jgi:hypothetical protein
MTGWHAFMRLVLHSALLSLGIGASAAMAQTADLSRALLGAWVGLDGRAEEARPIKYAFSESSFLQYDIVDRELKLRALGRWQALDSRRLELVVTSGDGRGRHEVEADLYELGMQWRVLGGRMLSDETTAFVRVETPRADLGEDIVGAWIGSILDPRTWVPRSSEMKFGSVGSYRLDDLRGMDPVTVEAGRWRLVDTALLLTVRRSDLRPAGSVHVVGMTLEGDDMTWIAAGDGHVDGTFVRGPRTSVETSRWADVKRLLGAGR